MNTTKASLAAETANSPATDTEEATIWADYIDELVNGLPGDKKQRILAGTWTRLRTAGQGPKVASWAEYRQRVVDGNDPKRRRVEPSSEVETLVIEDAASSGFELRFRPHLAVRAAG